ncbi:MAG: hypothetical protein ABI183_24475 [Polyangiaceae bacterium]
MNDKTKKAVAEIEKDLADAATPLGESEVALGVMSGAVVGSLGGIPGAVAGAVIGGAAAMVGAAIAAHEHDKKTDAEEKEDDEVDMDDRPTPTTPGT